MLISTMGHSFGAGADRKTDESFDFVVSNSSPHPLRPPLLLWNDTKRDKSDMRLTSYKFHFIKYIIGS